MGIHLIKLLSEDANNYITVSSRRNHPNKENLSYVQGNAHDIVFLSQLLKKKYDIIVDFMNYRTDEFRERYQLLLSSCHQYIFLSSSRVYANSEEPIKEDSPRLLDIVEDAVYLASDEYALAKARQENMLFDASSTNWTIIRPYITYSENRLQLGVMEKEEWLYRALHKRSIVFSKDIAPHTTTLTYGCDVARAMAALIGRKGAEGEAFHITSSESIRWAEVFDIYLQVLEKKKGKRPVFFMTDQVVNSQYRKYQVEYDRLFNRRFDNSKIGNFIDLSTFVSPRKGLPFCLESLCKHSVFRSINWSQEAKYDSLTHERVSLQEIPTIKQKVKYFLYRYII